MGSKSIRLLREYEAKVLDEEYKNFKFWDNDPGVALYCLLTAIDGLRVVLEELESKVHTYSLAKKWKMFEEGFVWAFRWYLNQYGKLYDPIPVAEDDPVEQAGELLIFAAEYATVASHYVMFGSDMVDVSVDEDTRVVTFIPKNEFSRGGYYSRLEAQLEKVDRREQSNDDLVVLAPECESGRIIFNNISYVDTFPDYGIPTEVLPLADSVNLAGFTAKEFNRFWVGIRKWSWCAQESYWKLANSGMPQRECSPVQVLTKKSFYRKMMKLTQLRESVLRKIVNILTFGSRKENSDIYIQPLLSTGQLISWSPWIILNCKFERNILKLMSQLKEHRGHAANIIGDRAGDVAKRISQLVSKFGEYDFEYEVEIEAEGVATDVDLFIYSKKTPQIGLMCEIKAVLSVDSINELKSNTKTLEGGQVQLEKANDIMCISPIEYKKRKFPSVNWEELEQIFKIVVTPESYPLRRFKEKGTPIVTLEVLEYFLTESDADTVESIYNFCKSYKWLSVQINDDLLYDDVTIGDVTYRLPYSTFDEQERN